MSELKDKKKQLVQKEKSLMKDIGKASDLAEKDLFRWLKLAAIGGVAGLIVYQLGKLAFGSKSENDKKKDKKVSASKASTESSLDSWQNKLLEVGIKTATPIVLGLVKDYLDSRETKKEESSKESDVD